MEEHFIYVQGYPEALALTTVEEQIVRDALTGQRLHEYVSVLTSNRRLLIRVGAISVLESRTKVLA